MREFLILIAELLFIAVVQTIVESVLDADSHKKLLKVVNIACIAASYIFLIRFVATHLLSELFAFLAVL